MADMNKTFEEFFSRLEKISEKLKSGDIALEDAIKSYEEGIKYYNECSRILEDAQQRVETINRK